MAEACVVTAHLAYMYRESLCGDRHPGPGASTAGIVDYRAAETVLACQIYLTHNYGFNVEAGYGLPTEEQKEKKDKNKKDKRHDTPADTSLGYLHSTPSSALSGACTASPARCETQPRSRASLCLCCTRRRRAFAATGEERECAIGG